MQLELIKTIQDVDEVKSFFYDIFPEEKDYKCNEFLYSINGNHSCKRLEYYFCVVDGKIVGIGGIYSNSDDECWLGWFGIKPEYRRRGYAREMLKKIFLKMQEYGYKVMRLYTDKSFNYNAYLLYQSEGLVEDYQYQGNIITMAKSLDNCTIPAQWHGTPLGLYQNDIQNNH